MWNCIFPDKKVYLTLFLWFFDRLFFAIRILMLLSLKVWRSPTGYRKRTAEILRAKHFYDLLMYRLLPKICDWAKYQNSHSSKSIRVTKLFFSQSDSPMSESFWQENRMVTHMLLDRCLFKHFSPVANFEQQSIVNMSKIATFLGRFRIFG